MENVTQGQTLMLGITIDPDGDVVLLVVVGREFEGNTQQLAVALTPDVSVHFAEALSNMAVEAHELQQELMTLTPKEAIERVEDIRARYASSNGD